MEKNHIIIDYQDYIDDEGHKRIKCKDLGKKFAYINSFIFDYLKEYHIPVAFIKAENSNSLAFYPNNRFPFSTKILNNADKHLSKIFSIKENSPLGIPVVEYHFGTSKDSCISENHLISFNIATNDDLKLINRICSKINAVLKSFFERRNAALFEISCFFGKSDDRILLVDDFTPKSMKVLPLNNVNNINPFRFTSSSEIKKYTDYIYNLTST